MLDYYLKNLCRDGKVSLKSFAFSLIPGPVILLLYCTSIINSLFNQLWLIMFMVIILTIQIYNYYSHRYNRHEYEIIWRSSLLGSIFSLGLTYAILIPAHWAPFFLFLAVVAFFHFSEYLVIAVTKPKALKIDSFMLNHSVAYHTAMITAVGEFFIELHFSTQMKSSKFTLLAGFCMCLAGDTIRKLAMLTAKSNFDHKIQTRKSQDHILVTHGIYSWSRHPAYVGWFWWAIGTQVLLANPVCLIIYIVVTWKFFAERIFEEEMLLVNFFGYQYIQYQRKVPTRLPFIPGYVYVSVSPDLI